MSGGNFYQQPGGYPPPPGGNPQPNSPGGNQPPPGYGPPPQQPSPYPPQAYSQPYGHGPIPGHYAYGYTVPEGLPTEAFGGFWIRLLAYIIDWLVMAVPGFVIGAVVGVAMAAATGPSAMGSSDNQVALQLGTNGVGLLLGWLYYSIMEVKFGGTLGKLALGLRVVDENGHYPTFGRATGRYFAKILSTCTLLIGFIIAGFHEKKRSLHDLIGGTYVVRKEYVNPATLSPQPYGR